MVHTVGFYVTNYGSTVALCVFFMVILVKILTQVN